MTKKLISVLLLSALLLAACQSAASQPQATEPTAAPEGEAPAEPAPQPTQVPFTDESTPCKPFGVLDLTLTTLYPGLPPVTTEDYAVGPEDAAVTLMVYSEAQCPFCAQIDPILDEFQSKFPEDVRVVFRFRPFPVSFHDKSIIASQAMVAAGMQGKFDEFRRFIFERQYQDPNDPTDAALSAEDFWSGLEPAVFYAWLADRVPELGINAEQLLKDMDSEEVVGKVKGFMEQADKLGITGTPSLFINGYQWPEDQRGVEVFSIYLRLIKQQAARQYECPPDVLKKGKTYTATISTTQGDIQVDLFPNKAPVAVNSFVYLAQQGFYDGLPFQANKDFVSSGDPSDTGYGGAGYAYLDERNDLTFDEPGMLAVYSIWPGFGYNGSMFFINKTVRTDHGERTIFGKITAGLDIVEKISLRDDFLTPVEDQILSVTINEN